MKRFLPYSLTRLPVLSAVLAAMAPLPALTLAAALLAPQPAYADTMAKLTVTVTDIKDAKGVMMIAVSNEAGYETGETVAAGGAPVTGASLTTTFDLPPGKYGIKLFHDVDGDGKMGTNPFGMPVEPYAFSNNAKGQFGPAKWAAAAFDVTADGATQTISLK